MKILIVEDNEDSRNSLMKQLRAYDHKVTAAVNGVEALEQALANPPDVIVSDILMPKMDGYRLCHEWKQNDKLKDIPFIFYTATYTTEEDEKFALSIGADAFICKPVKSDILIQRLSEVFKEAKSGLQPPPEVTPLEPSLYLTEYNKRIVAKLEDKMAQLEIEIAERKKSEEKLKKTQAELIQAEKLAALGRLSSGLFHEIKNPLAIILSGAGYLGMKLSKSDADTKESLEMIERAVLRANNVLQNLAKFARPSELKLERAKINDLIKDTLSLLEHGATLADIKIKTEFSQEEIYIKVDKNRMGQVLFDIMGNAVDAMPKGGEIKIKTYKTVLPKFSKDKSVCVIEIIDTGEGISKGDLKIESEVGKGIDIKIILPLAKKEGKENE